jgi:CheY-like chemotaxis protein
MQSLNEKIFVVEDNLMNAELIQEILKYWGYEVVLESRGDLVVDGVIKEKPNLVLLDLQLPAIDGYTLLKQLKSNESTKDIPVIAITSYALKGDKEKAITAGCDDYMSKPIDTRELPVIVERFVKG